MSRQENNFFGARSPGNGGKKSNEHGKKKKLSKRLVSRKPKDLGSNHYSNGPEGGPNAKGAGGESFLKVKKKKTEKGPGKAPSFFKKATKKKLRSKNARKKRKVVRRNVGTEGQGPVAEHGGNERGGER